MGLYTVTKVVKLCCAFFIAPLHWRIGSSFMMFVLLVTDANTGTNPIEFFPLFLSGNTTLFCQSSTTDQLVSFDFGICNTRPIFRSKG
jgi:hypothetical protein